MTDEPIDETASDGGYPTVPSITLATDTSSRGGNILTIATTEYRLAIKNRWAIALTVIFAVFSLGLLTFSGSRIGPEGFERVLGSLTVLAVYLVPLAALAFGYDTIVGAEDDGWLQALFALPIARWRVVVGGYLGRAAALGGAVTIGFGAAGVLLFRDFGFGHWHAFTAFLLATIGLALVFLAIAVLLSTIASAKTHALGGSLLIWAWFVLIHDLVALGLIAAFRLPDLVLEGMIVTNPTGVFRVLVLDSLDAGGEAGFSAIIAATGLSIPVLVGALIMWIVVPLMVATWLIRRRRI